MTQCRLAHSGVPQRTVEVRSQPVPGEGYLICSISALPSSPLACVLH